MQSPHAELMKSSSWLWMRWDPQLQEVLRWTAPYVENSIELDINLKSQWTVMINGCWGEWARLLGKEIISADEDHSNIIS